MDLPGTAVITGAASGIGRSIALKFASFNCRHLLLVDVNSAGLEETKQQILQVTSSRDLDASIHLQTCDITDAAVPEEIIAEAVRCFGGVHYLVNCAGIPGGFGTATETSTELFDRVQSLNVRATWMLQRAAIRQMLKQNLIRGKERGSIVNIGSIVSHNGIPNLSAYITSKHAVLGMTRAEAVDYASHGIRVNCVSPGIIDTKLGRDIPKDIVEGQLKPLIDKTPMRRAGLPEEVASCVVFLCSEMASYITGSDLAVDGGFSCT